MPLSPVPASNASLRKAAEHLRAGRLVAFPTETVYGLGADASNGEAVARIFAAKGRPTFNPLIVNVPDVDAVNAYAHLPPLSERLAAAFWPGGLTLVLDRKPDCQLSELVSAGLPSVAIRCPSHRVARALQRAAGCPIAAPSANRSGHVSATTAAHVADDIDDPSLAMILDDGPSPHGIESTIVDARGDVVQVLRPGAVTIDAMMEVVGGAARVELSKPQESGSAARSSPGQLESHYAPAKSVFLNVSAPAPGQALLAFGTPPAGHDGPTVNLSPTGDLVEAAANLFTGLRALDRSQATSIAVMAIPESGLGVAINDRLRRAAAPRDR